MTDRPNDGVSEPASAGGQPLHPDPTWPALGSPGPVTPGPAMPGPVPPGPVPPAPPAAGPPLAEPSPAEPPAAGPPKQRSALIAAASLAIVLLLCGGGGTAAFLLLRDAEAGEGAPEPVAAVEAFLEAVYIDRDAARATAMVCVEARDKAAIAEKVREVEGYTDTYVEPRFEWAPPTVATENKERAVVSVKLTMTTGDEKLSDQQLSITVVRKTGWWVCEVG